MIEELPKSLLEAVRYFSDLDKCDELMKEVKWPNGKIVCPKCGCESVSPVKGRRKMQCNVRACKRQFSFKVGTIFEDSPLGLDKWFVALWCVANCKNGISSHELGRALDVTQATAWFMTHRIRKAMEVGSFAKLAGEVESDETFIGGADVLQGNVLCNVEKGSHLYTDEALAYLGLLSQYVHETVNHGIGEYVKGRAHTNTLECFWSLVNRSLKGTWTHVEPYHLHRYTTEQAFRWNEREVNDAMRFLLVLRGVVGKRLTYRRLAAIGDSGFMGIK